MAEYELTLNRNAMRSEDTGGMLQINKDHLSIRVDFAQTHHEGRNKYFLDARPDGLRVVLNKTPSKTILIIDGGDQQYLTSVKTRIPEDVAERWTRKLG
jgi:hypothetical protein